MGLPILSGGLLNDLCTLAVHTKPPTSHSRPNPLRDFLLDLGEVIREIDDDMMNRRCAFVKGGLAPERAITTVRRVGAEQGK